MMDLSNILTVNNIWTLPILVGIVFIGGTICRNQFGINAKKAGLVIAALLSVAWMVWQFVPAAETPITIVIRSLGLFLLLYSLAFTSSDVFSKLATRLTRVQPAQPEPAQQSRSVAADVYYQPDDIKPSMADRLQW